MNKPLVEKEEVRIARPGSRARETNRALLKSEFVVSIRPQLTLRATQPPFETKVSGG